MSKRPVRHIYTDARARCLNPNVRSYPLYGGRGIEFRFTSFEQFIDAIGPRPSDKHSIDRIDGNGHYEPGNVRWATPKEQARNKRSNNTLRLITANGRTACLTEWANELRTSHSTIQYRLNNGWCARCAVTLAIGSGTSVRRCLHEQGVNNSAE